MFSSRLQGTADPHPLYAALDARRARGEGVVDLTVSNPTAVGLDLTALDLPEALARTEVTSYEPSPRGDRRARGAIADYYRAHGRTVDPEAIVLTASTSEAYSFLFRLLCDADDEVLVPRPGYPLFDLLAPLDLVRAVPYPLRWRDGWRIALERLEATVGPRTRAIVVVSPHNPTGHRVTREERDFLIDLCARRDLALIVDEVFLDHGAPSTDAAGSLAGPSAALTFVASGLSKVVAAPQVKLGWIVVDGPPALVRDALDRLDFVADSYLSVSTAAQLATPSLLARRPDVQAVIAERIGTNRRLVHDVVEGMASTRLLDCDGGWTAILRVYGLDAERFALDLLEREGVLVQPGPLYELDDDTLVLSTIVPTDDLESGMARLVQRLR